MIWHVSTEGVLNLDTPVQLTLFSWQSIPWLYWFVSFFQKHGLTGSFQEQRDIRLQGEAGSHRWVPANTYPGQKGSYHWTASWGRPEGVGKDGAKWEEHGWTVLACSCYTADHVNKLIWSRGRGTRWWKAKAPMRDDGPQGVSCGISLAEGSSSKKKWLTITEATGCQSCWRANCPLFPGCENIGVAQVLEAGRGFTAQSWCGLCKQSTPATSSFAFLSPSQLQLPLGWSPENQRNVLTAPGSCAEQ